jgi:class 3 adenylate cyclase/tetratricopeptide (TPR) repeat protein
MEGTDMLCPKCQFENPEKSNFCLECGQKLEQKCPQCEKALPAAAKFCNACGYQLPEKPTPYPKKISFDEKLDRIQRYLPKGLTEKILSQRDRIEGERRQVTVMFCDLEGFTALSEKLGTEETYTVIDHVYEILIHKVHDYEGTVNEMTGDGIMALFGAPIALEDAPQRAIRSSLAIHREMTKFSDSIIKEKKNISPLKMRIGIHTGMVVVGTLGNNLRVEFKAVGDTVNLASRIENLAESGITLVSEETFKLTEGLFRFEAVGARPIKGKKEPVYVYQVIAPSSRRTRFDVSAERGLAPLVGRDRELELLMDGFRRSKAENGQAYSIVSEAGGGKSRLLYEFRKAVSNEDITFLEGRCLSYSKGLAYHPIIDILKSNFDIRENDDDFRTREKIINGLKFIKVDEEAALPYLLELLSVKDSGIDQIITSPEERKERILATLKNIVIKGAEIRPLIMAIEDLHWIDQSSEACIKEVMDNISGARIFFIFTYRPEFVHTWGVRSYHQQINLNRLSNREGLEIVYHLMATRKVDARLEDLILQKTEGVPLFIEELIRSLLHLKLIYTKNGTYCLKETVQDVHIPSTIQDIIMARVDSLPEQAKYVLQAGAAIEREFSYHLLKAVIDLSENELQSCLSAMKNSELIYERGIFPDSTYVFKHSVTREVIYDSILSSRKKQLHEAIGSAIEMLYQSNLAEYFGVLTEHFVSSGNYEKGADYAKKAGKKAQKAASYGDAIEYSQKSVSCLDKLPVTSEVEKKLVDARVTLGLYYNQMSQHPKAKEAVNPIIQLALDRNFQRRISQIYTIIGTYDFAVLSDYTRAVEYLKNALKIAEEQNDFVSLWVANHWLGHAYSENCEFDKALKHLENSLNINLAVNIVWGISIMKSCIAHNVYGLKGDIDLQFQTSSEGLELAEKSGDALSRTEAYVSHGYAQYFKGHIDEAEAFLKKGCATSERINYIAMNCMANFGLNEIYFEKKDYRRCQERINKAILALKALEGWPEWIKFDQLAIIRAKVLNNEKDFDLKSLDENLCENKMKTLEGWTANLMGEIYMHLEAKSFSESEHWILKAIEADNRNGMRWHLARDYALYAQLLKRKGDHENARENLGKAVDIMKKCGADGWVEKYEKEQSAL